LKEEQRLRVFDSRVLRKIFGSEGKELRRDWRKLCNEKLHDLYCSRTLSTSLMNKRRKRSMRHLFGRRKMRAWFRWENLKQGGHLEGLGVDGTTKLKFI
jgi:hypothetical protein